MLKILNFDIQLQFWKLSRYAIFLTGLGIMQIEI